MMLLMMGYPDSGIAHLDGRLRVELGAHLSQRKRASAFGTSHNQPQLALIAPGVSLSSLSLHHRTNFDRHRNSFDVLLHMASVDTCNQGERGKKKEANARAWTDTVLVNCKLVPGYGTEPRNGG
jgi:hypothetical protein